MNLDELREFLARSDELTAEIAKDVFTKLVAQPAFMAHRDEVVADYTASPVEGGILAQVTALVASYKRVCLRHDLPPDVVIDDDAPAN